MTDEDVSTHIIEGLRRHSPDLDVLSAPEAGTLHLPDEQVLAFAADQGRMLFSHDNLTMPSHFALFLAQGRTSPGLITAPQTAPIGATLRDLILIWEDSAPEEWINIWTRLPL